MIELKLSEIAEAVSGELVGADLLITGSVETDSRLVSAGSLFVAKPGEVTAVSYTHLTLPTICSV